MRRVEHGRGALHPHHRLRVLRAGTLLGPLAPPAHQEQPRPRHSGCSISDYTESKHLLQRITTKQRKDPCFPAKHLESKEMIRAVCQRHRAMETKRHRDARKIKDLQVIITHNRNLHGADAFPFYPAAAPEQINSNTYAHCKCGAEEFFGLLHGMVSLRYSGGTTYELKATPPQMARMVSKLEKSATAKKTVQNNYKLVMQLRRAVYRLTEEQLYGTKVYPEHKVQPAEQPARAGVRGRLQRPARVGAQAGRGGRRRVRNEAVRAATRPTTSRRAARDPIFMRCGGRQSERMLGSEESDSPPSLSQTVKRVQPLCALCRVRFYVLWVDGRLYLLPSRKGASHCVSLYFHLCFDFICAFHSCKSGAKVTSACLNTCCWVCFCDNDML